MQFVLEQYRRPAFRTGALPGCEDHSTDLVDAILEEASKFAGEVLAPLNREGDKGHKLADAVVTTGKGFKEAYHQFRDAGWWACVRAGRKFGGQIAGTGGNGHRRNVVFRQPGVLAVPLLTLGALEAINHHASDELKAIYLPKMSSGEWPGTMNLTEPQAGSDLALVRSKAVPNPNGDGTIWFPARRFFITWGEHDMADNLVTWYWHVCRMHLPV